MQKQMKFCPVITTTTIDVFVQSIGTNMAIGVKSVKSFCDVRKYVLQKQAMIVKLENKNQNQIILPNFVNKNFQQNLI